MSELNRQRVDIHLHPMKQYIDDTIKESITSHGNGGGGGGEMLEQRVINLEKSVSDIRVDIAAIKAQIPHLATKSDISDMQTSLIKWMVGTAIAIAALAFTIAKYIHP